MGKLILDAELRKKLNDGNGGAEVCDESGAVVGYYLPKDEYMRLRYAEAKAMVSDKEIAEARKEMLEHGGVTTAEILADLAEVRRQWEARQE